MFFIIKFRKKMKATLDIGRDARKPRGTVNWTNAIATTAAIMKFPTMINLYSGKKLSYYSEK
jgi:hypothetical protein